MFSYLGSKSKLVNLYPEPKHGRIIEPFAGSARYSLRYFENDVELYDLSDYVVEVWRYLMQASERDILSLPNVQSKVSLDTITSLSQAERWLIGFSLCRGKSKPRKVGHGQNSWAQDRTRIANNLYKIRHWTINQASYTTIRNRKATWFVDPPYQHSNSLDNGDRYPHSEIDYTRLASWVQSRRGLVIACEYDSATYLPFQLLTRTRTNTNNRTAKEAKEMVYIQGA